MSLDQTKWAAWSQAVVGGVSGSRLLLVSTEEGVKGSERSRDDTATQTITINSKYIEFALDIPVGTVIPDTTVFLVSLRGKMDPHFTDDARAECSLIIDGVTTYTGEVTPFDSTTAETLTGTITVTSAITVETGVVVRVTKSADAGFTEDLVIYYAHDDTHFGIDSSTTGSIARSPLAFTPVSPAPGTHANPTAIDSHLPDFAFDVAYAYADDDLTLVKYTDTLRTAAHSASDATTQTVGGLDDETDAFTALHTRRVTFSADATRKADTLTNTYYVAEIKNGATSQGTQAYELRLAAEKPLLTSLAGSSGSPVIVSDLEPVLSWTDPNATSTHWRVKVYAASNDAEMWDSTETAVGVTHVVIPAAAALASLTSYYAVVTVMRGSGGSSWSLDSERGYFQVDKTATAVKITSHEGSSDAPEVITDTTPTITWTFPRTQHSFNLTVIDESDQSVHYNSGWTISATQSHTVPGGSALTAGGTFSVQVQLKDTIQDHVFSSDKRAWLHANESTIDAPVLDAEADCTSLDAVTLAWTAPTVNDGDALTYSCEVTQTIDGVANVTTYSTGSAVSLILGRQVAGTYSWRVRATDVHSLAGTWAAADEFTVTHAGVAPSLTLEPLTSSSTTTPRTTWVTQDVDGDAQTHYQVQIASDAGFTSIVQDSGETASTAMYHQHTALSVGTYYRQVRVKAGGDYSAWVDDSFAIVAATSQTDEWELYLDAEGTPTALNLATYPLSGVTVTRRLDGPTSFSFEVNNFDGLEAGIDDDEEMLLYLKDSAGKRLEFRGQVQTKDAGLMLHVEAADIACHFDRWQVTISKDHATIAQIVAAMVENPTGSHATGIVTHCEEIEDPDTAGKPITCLEWQGQGKTVAAWLSEFGQKTGYRWYCECLSGVWHFWWFSPANCPTWAVTLKDDISYDQESASQWRTLDGAKLTKSRAEYANRIRYQALYEPPALPAGVANWDALWCESSGNWGAYADVTAGTDAADYAAGSKSITLTYSITGGAGGTTLSRSGIPLGYFKIPAAYRDFQNNFFDAFAWQAKCVWTLDGSPFVYAPTTQGGDGYYGQIMARATAYSGADVGPTGGMKLGDQGWFRPGFAMDRTTHASTSGPFVGSHTKLNMDGYVVDDRGDDFDANNVGAVGVGLIFPWNHGYRDIIIPEGEVFTCKLWLDNIRLVGGGGAAGTGEFYVETAAVTAGTEVPIEAELSTTGMSQSEASALALTWLDIKNRDKETISGLSVAGVRTVPMRTQVPVALTGPPVAAGTYPLSEITWRAGDAGWSTEIVLGDMPSDVVRTIERLSHTVKKIAAESQR